MRDTTNNSPKKKKRNNTCVCWRWWWSRGECNITVNGKPNPRATVFFFLHWSSFLVTLEKNSLTEIKGTTVYNTVVSVHSQTCATITTDFSAF